MKIITLAVQTIASLFLLVAAASADESKSIDFARDVAPIFRDRCLSCHAETAQGGLQLTQAASLLKGGDSGPVIVPGNSEKSRLIQLITAPKDADEKMPPDGSRLSAANLATIRRWIDAGAEWPAGFVLKSPKAAALEHWAFQPIVRPGVPGVAKPQALHQAVDGFVQRKLEVENVAPSGEADKITLLRRATLDLIGLPPTPGEVDDFLVDDQPDAYERQLDRLFASPHYGERWARPWLDLAHFADTDGYLTDQLRPVAWRYREWLIDALNRDLPFDQFTTEQLAGDLLPNPTPDQLLATGYLRNTLSNREGGADLEQYRVEQVIDRTQMVGVTWLGLSVGCARCHDHKFDPISQKEFYQFYAFLDQADEVNLDLPLPGEAAAYAAKIDEYRKLRAETLAPYQPGLDELQKQWETKMLEAFVNPEIDALWNRQWEVLGLVWGGNMGEGQLEGCVIARTPWEKRTPDEHARLQDYFIANGAVVDSKRFAELKLGEIHAKTQELKKAVPWPTRAMTIRQARQPRVVHIHQRGEFRVPGDVVQPGTFAFLPVKIDQIAGGDLRPGVAAQYSVPSPPLRGRGAGERGRAFLVAAESSPIDRPKESVSAVVSTETARPLSLTLSPAAGERGQEVALATINVQHDVAVSPTRLELAKWLLAEGNPLMARVVVNRLWQEFFGRALVDPPSDFGLRGQPPSHPELLDWLADEYRRREWGTKAMHRVVMTSATYRQSSQARPELRDRDPQNRWLARQSSLRFTADQVRDVTLAVSGLYADRVGGPSVFPPQPDSVMNEGFYQHGWKSSEGQDRYRRGIYTWIARLSPFAQNVTFDAPPTNAICARRDRTNSPLQALTLLNDPVFFEAAKGLSKRVMAETDAAPASAANQLFRWAVSRPPSAVEQIVLVEYYQTQLAELKQQPETVEKLTPDVVDPNRRVEQAAWTSAASVVLNLHEFITRE